MNEDIEHKRIRQMGIIEDSIPTLTIGELKKQLERVPEELNDVPVQVLNKEGKLTNKGSFYLGGSNGRHVDHQLRDGSPIEDYWSAIFEHNDIIGLESSK